MRATVLVLLSPLAIAGAPTIQDLDAGQDSDAGFDEGGVERQPIGRAARLACAGVPLRHADRPGEQSCHTRRPSIMAPGVRNQGAARKLLLGHQDNSQPRSHR